MIVLLGGTGTLGKELTRQILAANPSARIIAMSRDELKQKEAQAEFPSVSYVLGDIRDRQAVRNVVQGAEAVFLLAAIKHVDVAEKNPLETVKTNFFGVVNVAEESMAANVPYVVFSNTDKAVLPITTYGYSKALAQDYLLSLNGKSETRFSAFAWGNICASRGSVIPAFIDTLTYQRKVCLTDLKMTRFWITIEAATAFMLANYRTAPTDRSMIPPLKGATVLRVAQTVAKLLGISSYKIDVIGLRGTEKIHEVLQSAHSGCLRSDTCEQYSDEELTNLLAPIVEASSERIAV